MWTVRRSWYGQRCKKKCPDLPMIKTTNDSSFTFSRSTTNRSERPHPSDLSCARYFCKLSFRSSDSSCAILKTRGRTEIIVHKQQQDCHQCLTCVFALQVWRWWALLCTTSLTTPGLANSSTWRTSMWWRPTEVWTPDPLHAGLTFNNLSLSWYLHLYLHICKLITCFSRWKLNRWQIISDFVFAHWGASNSSNYCWI